MKRTTLKFSRLLTVALVATAFTACDKDDAEIYVLEGTLNGANVVPAVTTNATGRVSGTYDATNNALTYTVSWTGLSGTAQAGTGMAGSTINGPGVNAQDTTIYRLTLTNNAAPNNTSGVATGQVNLTDAQEAALLGGRWFARVATAANPNGEIRGQITTRKQDD